VSGIRVMNGIRKIQFTAPISSGSSGGPLLNERGEVVGITAQTLTSAQNINFAVPIGYLKPFLNDPELQQLYDEALQRDLFYTMRNNHRFIDKVRRSIIRGEVQERPGGLTQWHSKYSPYDPDVQQIYERALYSKKIAKDPQVLQIVQSLIKRHIVRRVRQK
jgi:S1-C subfamily serine protease